MKIVYHSFNGRYSDNPRALHERLRGRDDLDQVWIAEPDHLPSFPDDVATVPAGTGEVLTALESADLVIANTHTEGEWRKKPGSTYFQTWHGTPLKRIHNDVLWAPEGRLAHLDRDVACWDLLLSPNPASTPLLRQAFGYSGEILESGYPRNDVLLTETRDQRRAAVRAELGLTGDRTVILYTPTWRDDEYFLDGAPPVSLALDFPALVDALGPGCTVLVRAHNAMTGRLVPPLTPGVLDVSYFRDIADLYLVADVLVTDYSSAMFDFAVTGRPIVFYAYDLERYRDTVRGFYFDLFEDPPGPVVRTPEELVAALRSLKSVEIDYQAAYRHFAKTFCMLEDGHATDRVLARLGL